MKKSRRQVREGTGKKIGSLIDSWGNTSKGVSTMEVVLLISISAFGINFKITNNKDNEESNSMFLFLIAFFSKDLRVLSKQELIHPHNCFKVYQ